LAISGEARTPEELETLLEDAFTVRDGTAVASLFEARGIVVPGGGLEEARGSVADRLPFLGRYLGDRIGYREWRNFDGVISQPMDVSEDFFQLPVLEDFVTDGEFHERVLARPASVVERREHALAGKFHAFCVKVTRPNQDLAGLLRRSRRGIDSAK